MLTYILDTHREHHQAMFYVMDLLKQIQNMVFIPCSSKGHKYDKIQKNSLY